MYTIMSGNPSDGFSLHGIFETHDDALEHAMNGGSPIAEWWIVEIENLET